MQTSGVAAGHEGAVAGRSQLVPVHVEPEGQQNPPAQRTGSVVGQAGSPGTACAPEPSGAPGDVPAGISTTRSRPPSSPPPPQATANATTTVAPQPLTRPGYRTSLIKCERQLQAGR